MIDLSSFAYFVATEQRSTDYRYLQPGNIIPHEWYKRFSGAEGPDLVCISILSDIVALYRWGNSICESKNTDSPRFIDNSLSLSYEYFEDKFGFGKERTRRALVRLEQQSVLKRKICNIELSSGKRINRLLIFLDQDFFHSCFRDPQLDIRAVAGQGRNTLMLSSNPDTLKISQNDLYCESTSEAAKEKNPAVQSPRWCGDHIRNKNNIINNRSSAQARSNFYKNSDLENNGLKTSAEVLRAKEGGKGREHGTSSTEARGLFTEKAAERNLRDFYPLSEKDCSKLQELSGREFSLRAMNEILLDMSQRIKDRIFRSKKGFLEYMGKAFRYEKRDAVKVSNERFRIKNNLKIEGEGMAEKIAREEEKYLSEVESRREVSPEMHLKKKLASVLERSKAYKLLTAYKFGKRVGEEYELYLSRAVPELTEHDKKLILEQVKATQERVDFGRIGLELITSLKIIEERPRALEVSTKDISMITEQVFGQMTSKEVAEKLRGQGGIWGKARAGLIEYLNDHKDSGKWIDRNWFSKLEAEENEEQKTIKLKAPTSFIVRWISDNYASLMKRIIADYGYEVEMC
jgi:hypothetical protein